jgi:hypothetical protein
MEAEAVKMGRFERVRGRARAMLSEDPDFEVSAPAGRSRPLLRDSEVVKISSDSESDLELQTFYFSMKLFRFMCERIIKERIEQAGRRDSVVRKGVLLKRAERKERTDKLREFVEQQGAEKPSGSEHAAIKRKRAAQKKNTDSQMGRGSRDQRKRHQSACESEASCQEQSQSHPETSQFSQSQVPQKKKPKLWGKVHVPPSVIQGSFVKHVDDVGNDDEEKSDTQRAIRMACKEVLSEFTEMLDDFVKVDSSFTLPSTRVLNQLKKSAGLTVKQQLRYCSENGFEVTQAFIRRLNSSPEADEAFGLSGDSGFLFVLLNMKKHLNFCVEIELTDAANKCHQYVTVACVGEKFVHVQGGKMDVFDPLRSPTV